MFVELLPPSIIMIVGGLSMLFASRRVRDVLTVLLPILTLGQIWNIDGGQVGAFPFLAYELITVYVHPYSHFFASAFALMALAGGVFAMHARNRKEQSAAYVYAGAAIGVTFSGDLLTFFFYWELMALAATLVIWSADTESSRAAGIRYALMHFLGGVVLMAGIAGHVYVTGVTVLPEFELHINEWIWTSSVFLNEERVYTDYPRFLHLQSLGIWLIFIGVMVNMAAPPFSAWLADAYPEASPTGMVFLSVFTTKIAIFTLITLFAGAQILVPIGLAMVVYGLVMAVLQSNAQRLLAYGIVNQMGFKVLAVGVGSAMALQGAAAMSATGMVYMALMLMTVGSVVYMTGRRHLCELGGLYRSMPLTSFCAVVAMIAMAAFPFSSGLAGKALVSAAIAEQGEEWVWYALTAGSAGVFLYAGMVVWQIFFGKDSGLRPADPPSNMRWAMIALTTLCLVVGIFPQHTLYALLPGEVNYSPNSPATLLHQSQLLLYVALGYLLTVPVLGRRTATTLDLDWLYRKLAKNLLILLEKALRAGYTACIYAVQHGVRLLVTRVIRLTAPGGFFAETKTLANAALIMATLLAGYLLLYNL